MLHVITRTSNRPKFFKICYESVHSQTYPELNHIVLSDDPKDTYVYEYNNINIINLDRTKFSHFELYLNEAIKIIPENDYFCVIDDDDFYTTPESLAIGMKALQDADGDIVFWKSRAACATVPEPNYWKKALPMGQLAMFAWIVKKEFTRNLQFNPMYGGDHDFIDRVVDGRWETPHCVWVDQLLASTHPARRQGCGERMDLKN